MGLQPWRQVDGDLAVFITSQHGFDHLGLQALAQDHLPAFLVEAGAALAEGGRDFGLSIFQAFFDPGTVAVIVAFALRVAFRQELDGLVGILTS